MTPIDRAASPSTAELRAQLFPVLRDRHRMAGTIEHLDRRASAYQTSFPIEELTITMNDGRRVELMLKVLGRNGLDAAAESSPFLVETLHGS